MFFIYGSGKWNRTTDLRLMSPALYPTELPRHIVFVLYTTFKFCFNIVITNNK